MSEAPGLKLTIVGPSGSGKSTLSNFLSGHADNLTAPTTYTPTIGVRCEPNSMCARGEAPGLTPARFAAHRILECEKEVGSSSVPVEIWDVGGSTECVMSLVALLKRPRPYDTRRSRTKLVPIALRIAGPRS